MWGGGGGVGAILTRITNEKDKRNVSKRLWREVCVGKVKIGGKMFEG